MGKPTFDICNSKDFLRGALSCRNVMLCGLAVLANAITEVIVRRERRKAALDVCLLTGF